MNFSSLNLDVISFVLLPQASEPCLNFNIFQSDIQGIQSCYFFPFQILPRHPKTNQNLRLKSHHYLIANCFSCQFNRISTEVAPTSSFSVAMMPLSRLIMYSFWGNQDSSEMIGHLKFIFVWIFLIPQPTGNVFIWDFVLRFLVFTFFFRIRTLDSVIL